MQIRSEHLVLYLNAGQCVEQKVKVFSPVMTVPFPLSVKDQSTSLLSVHMGVDGSCLQRKASQSMEDSEMQEELMATGGRSFILVRILQSL